MSDDLSEIHYLERRIRELEAEPIGQHRPLTDYDRGWADATAQAADRIHELEAERDKLRKLDAEYGRVEAAIIMADPNFDGDPPQVQVQGVRAPV
ncbi:MAG: hypothetical protein FH759_04705 [Sediminimonas qiaohouensis]|uniref:Uncharacterized protein n=1 Tax=Sediminimonas qiaohouensis TaxID=552061 RepID=A0A7C9HAC0_9RHOB|nr:hypothetical protein [Sediminimonas qiaohouensis]MTJ03984.1 hypothetical protein [Sediminimonas qiaohouensis]